MPAPFVRCLRTLHVEYGRTSDLAQLLGELQQLIATHELGQELGTSLTPASEALTRDDLHLVCWMLVR